MDNGLPDDKQSNSRKNTRLGIYVVFIDDFLSTLEFGLLFNTFLKLNGDVIHRRRGKVSRYSSTRSNCQDILLVDIPDG